MARANASFKTPTWGKDLVKREHQSDAIASLEYFLEDQQVRCEFNQRGTYWYFDVPPEVFAEWNTAGSRGTYFNLYIKDKYSYERD